MDNLNDFKNHSESDIIREILAGKISLFEILISRVNPILYKVGRSYGFNHEDVQDIMQDTFVNAFTNLAQFQNRSSFKTWLVRILLNNCYSKKQSLSTKNEIVLEMEITDRAIPLFTEKNNENTEKTVINKELSRVIENAIGKIPLEYRMVFSLREINSLNTAETAEALDISEVNVKVRLSRAKAMLRKEIEKIYSPEDIYEFNLIYCDLIVNRVMSIIAHSHNVESL